MDFDFMKGTKVPSLPEMEAIRDSLKLACAQFEDTSMDITRYWSLAKTDEEKAKALQFLAWGLDDDIQCVRNAQEEAYRLLGKPVLAPGENRH